jgi:hypothetical protein
VGGAGGAGGAGAQGSRRFSEDAPADEAVLFRVRRARTSSRRGPGFCGGGLAPSWRAVRPADGVRRGRGRHAQRTRSSSGAVPGHRPSTGSGSGGAPSPPRPETRRQGPPGAPADRRAGDRREHCFVIEARDPAVLRTHSRRRWQGPGDFPQSLRHGPSRPLPTADQGPAGHAEDGVERCGHCRSVAVDGVCRGAARTWSACVTAHSARAVSGPSARLPPSSDSSYATDRSAGEAI